MITITPPCAGSVVATPASQVERRRALPYREFVDSYLRAQRPVIITDALDGWRAWGSWTPASLRSRHGLQEICIDGRSMTFAAFLDRIARRHRDAPPLCFERQRLASWFPDMLGDVMPAPCYWQRNWLRGWFAPPSLHRLLNRKAAMELCIGGDGARFPLQRDEQRQHLFHAQINGVRRFALLDPQQSPWLYPDGHRSRLVHLDEVDRARWPLAARASALTCELEAGELLFIPGGWWHGSRLIGAGIGVSLGLADAGSWRSLRADLRARAEPRHPRLARALDAYLGMVGWWKGFAERLSPPVKIRPSR